MQETYVDQEARPVEQSARPAPPAGKKEQGVTGCTPESFRANVLNPPGILRMVEWLLVLVSFAAMASFDDKISDRKYESQRGFLLFATIVAWLYTMAIIPMYMFGFPAKFSWFNLAEFAIDILFTLFLFAAGIAAAAGCDKTLGENPVNGDKIKACDSSSNKPQVAAAFALLAFFVFCGSVFFSFQRWRNN